MIKRQFSAKSIKPAKKAYWHLNSYCERKQKQAVGIEDNNLEATIEILGNKVITMGENLSAAPEKFKEVVNSVLDKAIAGARATDKAVKENRYKAMAIAMGAGVIIGYIAGRRTTNE